MANITTRVTSNAVSGAGTITTSTSSVTVTGSGTSFLTAVTIGQLLYTAADVLIGTVLSIQSNTSLTLVANAAVDVSGGAYKIYSTGITTKGAPLTNQEIDANFINLNNAVVAGANSSVTNVANTLVKRGPSGEFSAGAITAAAGTTVGGTTVPSTNSTQAQMEAGTDTTTRFMTAANIKQAIDVLALQGIGGLNHDMTGFEDRAFSTISIDASTRVFTLTNNGTCNIWYRGKKFAISSPLTITLANVSGGRWITFNTTNSTLSEGSIGADPDIINSVLVAYIYLDVSNSTCIILGDERHLAARDVEWHLAQHNTTGAIWKSGGTVSYTINSTASVGLSFTSPVVFQDEDIVHSIVHSASPNGNYQQNITGTAQIPTLYLQGTTYVQQAASGTPWILGTSRLRYNPVSSNNGSLTDIGENQYVNYWIVATNDKTYPVKAIMGRTAYSTIDSASAETLAAYGLPWPEVVPMYMVTLQSNGAWQLPTRSMIVKVRELTQRKTIAVNDFNIPLHSNLAQLETDDHPQYVHTSIARTITAAHTFTNDITFSSTGFIKLPSGTTAQRPASPLPGMIRFNTTLGFVEQYTSDNLWAPIAPSPTVTTVSPTTFSGAAGTTITVNGTNFDTGATVYFISASGVSTAASTTTRISSSQLQATTPINYKVTDEPLKVKVQNATGLNYTLDNALDCGGSPTWNTAAGNIATIFDRYGSYNPIATVSASDPDGSTITYSIVSGAVPAGCSFNTSNGQISGDPNDSDSSHTDTFTVRASDPVGNYTDRTFSITVNPALDGSSAARGPNSGLALYNAFPSLASGTYWIKPNGNSAQQMYVDMTTDGGGYDFYQCSGCSATSYANQGSGCPAGMYYVYGRTRDHWSVLLNRYGSGWMSNVGSVYKPNGGGNFTGCVMRNPTYYGSGCGEWQVGDGGKWWIRNNTHGEPNGDYNGYGWQQIYFGTGLDPIGFNDGGAYSTGSSYICSTNAKG